MSEHNTMKAIRLHTYGGPEVLVYEDAPRPRPEAEDVLIRIHAAGVNPVDWKTREGRGMAWMKPSLPLILGWDVSGVVEGTGAEVTTFRPGDEVYGMIRFPQIGAAYAEYATAPAAHLAKKPATIDHVHAAAVPLAALTAWQALFDAANLQAGQAVLIHAAAGGVGHLAVQLAKWKGAHVIGTASARNAGFLRELGVDQVIDYTTTPFETAVRNVDVVLATIGGETLERSFAVLRPGGILASIVGQVEQERSAARDIRAEAVLVRPDAAQLTEIARLIDGGHLRPLVESTFPLAQAHQAHELNAGLHTRGKIVLRVAD